MGMRSKLRFWLGVVLLATTAWADRSVEPLTGEDFARYLHDLPIDSRVPATLRNVAELGDAGRAAGPEVLRFLNAPDPGSRLAAARALGFIRYQPALPALLAALDDPVDVRLNWVAAESLGRLRNPHSVDALQRATDEHWYPPVRLAAANALRHIREDTPYATRLGRGGFPAEFFRYSGWQDDFLVCHPALEGRNPYGERGDSLGVSDATQLEKLHYRYDRFGGEVEGLTEMKDAIPTVALKVDRGWLAGSDRGEWGGELVFIRDDGKQFPLIHENVFDVFRFGNRILVITGLAHMGTNEGGIHVLSADDASGRWTATLWRALPLAPRNARIDHGDLRIELYGGDAILVTADGAMRMAPCG